MILQSGSNKTVFKKSSLRFIERGITNVFRGYNKTVQQTIQHRRYQNLAVDCQIRYGAELEKPLGQFLYDLKLKGDNFYKKFLNKYGDLEYCHFCLGDPAIASSKGLYIYTVEDKLMYIGQTKNSFSQRIDPGYGKISPKNCYKDGQATNCHKNALIAEHEGSVKFWIHLESNEDEIMRLESNLIDEHQPLWNL